ncbi:dynein [Thecamonas trahens ATCC 50062]|uniref:Dynein n=1 Tax=Thecamonas trahens ATCC 50062 TaxID=461836 RepID=A0A0L0D6M5_THETB|nr:dynein [Thecamonas trahens ATCC 50062]KNC46958.1 dynein [Thecamonas trahens ATCC 50062]|eukprot:XP_013760229.1 dynein [Thecamonas trahens ATCC 50062]
MVSLLKVMERMVNLNTYQAIAHDYKYLEFPLDKLASNALTGTLMPLWEFESAKVKKRHVTALAWNPEYPDLFAVGFGSYDFGKRRRGRVYCYTLKNPSHPEYAFETESGVMSLDFHQPPHSSLLAVGLYDGSVLVYDIKVRSKDPIFRSTIRNGKHTDPVWQVQWQEDDLSKKHNFFSVSSDGRVTSWTMVKSDLVHTDIIELQLVDNVKAAAADEEAALFGLAGGLCFDFNHTFEHLFIVGVEDGYIHKCSKAYNSQYLETYVGHVGMIHAVQWNPFHPSIFISASSDWTVKIWDHALKTPLMSFDLNNSVGDVAWAPYSSTVFAACTADGKIYVFDLSVNRHEPLCDQKVVRKARLTHLAFNPDPDNYTLIVGDDRGVVRSFRLSPNLRQIAKIEEPKPQSLLLDAPLDADLDAKPKAKPKTRAEIEVERLDAIFAAQDKSVTMIA